MKDKRLGGSAWRIVMAGVLLVMAATACGGAQATPTAEPAMPTAEPVAPTAEPATPAVEPEPAKITVTFEGGQCIYIGPDEVPAGRITVVLDVEDQTEYEEYGLAVVTLDEGKTFEDLDAWPSTSQPSWAQVHGLLEEVPQGSRAEMTVIALEGPLFLVCFTAYPITKSGTLGPVQVVNLVTSADELAGVWHRTTRTGFGGEVYRQYSADGTYRMGSNPEELETRPKVEGEFWFEGDQLVVRDVAGLPSYDVCVQAGQVGRYTVERLANGHIRFIVVEDECGDRAGMMGAGEMEPVR